jgi:protein sidekick
MPQNVEAFVNTSMNPAKIRVSWKQGFDGNSPLINHLVEMRTLNGDLTSEWTTIVENVPQEMCCSVLIDNLRPSSTVEFRVIAVNRFGQGRPSLPSQNITMPQQPPSASPRDVKGSGRSSSSIIVQWQAPPADQWNGDILGYIVRYRLAGYPTLPWIEKNVTLNSGMHHHAAPPGHQLAKNVLIDQLISFREYEVQVAAFNDLGPGVFSKSIEVAPLESAPMQAPNNVQVEVLNSTDIRVSFDPLDQQLIPGVNLGYKVELWKGNPGTTLYKLVRIFPDYSRLSQQIGSLEKFGRYNLTVLCFTSAADGPRSDALEFQTDEDVPGPVSSINFDQVLYSSVLVQWQAPKEPNGVIIKYILRHWQTNQPSDKNVIEVGGQETNATIEGLRASTHYSVDLQALTQVGAGPPVEAKFESGIPPTLPSQPTSVAVSDIGARSVVVQYIPGFDGHSYIKNWIVEAKIGSSSVFTSLFTIRLVILTIFNHIKF